MTCRDIEKQLPAYLDDGLSPEEKQCIDDHLDDCPACRRAMADLKRMQACLTDLDEVEPPPFLEQRIMARVREEAAQKQGFLRKLFYPLHIKIPIQALATLLIAVLAVYVYRQGDPEIRRPLPLPIPVTESKQERPAMEPSREPAAPPAEVPAQRPSAAPPRQEKSQWVTPPPSGNADMAGNIKAPQPSTDQNEWTAVHSPPPPPVGREKGVEPPAAENMMKAQAGSGMQETAGSPPSLRSEQKRKQDLADAGSPAMKSMRAPSASLHAVRSAQQHASEPSAMDLTLLVGNRDAAIPEIERHLAQARATIVERRHFDDRDTLTVALAAENLPYFLNSLGTIGRVRPAKPTAAPAEERVTVIIRIVAGR